MTIFEKVARKIEIENILILLAGVIIVLAIIVDLMEVIG